MASRQIATTPFLPLFSWQIISLSLSRVPSPRSDPIKRLDTDFVCCARHQMVVCLGDLENQRILWWVSLCRLAMELHFSTYSSYTRSERSTLAQRKLLYSIAVSINYWRTVMISTSVSVITSSVTYVSRKYILTYNTLGVSLPFRAYASTWNSELSLSSHGGCLLLRDEVKESHGCIFINAVLVTLQPGR